MKKFLFCLIGITAVATMATAQNKSTFGIRAGMNISNMTFKDDGVSVSPDSKIGFHAGLSYQLPLLRQLPLYLETGLNFTTRGAKIANVEGAADLKLNAYYLQVPVALSWHFDVDCISLQPFVGAYYGLGISGEIKMGNESVNIFKKETIDGEGFQMMKRSEIGLRFGLGVAVKKHYYIGVGYDLGLTNILKESGDEKVKNGNFFISLGYNF